MVNIPKHVQEFLPGKLSWVATASCKGEPNVTPKGSIKVLDDSHLLFADLFALKTVKNLRENNRVAVTVVDPYTFRGYQLKGVAEIVSSGPLFEDTAREIRDVSRQLGQKLPPVRHLIRVTVDAVFDQSLGPGLGKQIA